MLDLRFIRTNPDVVRKAIADKGEKAELDRLLELDEAARAIIVESDELKRQRNAESERIATLKKAGEDASEPIARMREVAASIKEYDEKLAAMREEIEAL
ncbi:MAG: serine--tRNA ligase, partial [Candidatus Eisenbacteria sp.]|nr:serine--tRNA ligase [Candidatus Eisenbacteria bacterium]